MTTSTYDGEDFTLFTSLSKAVKAAQLEFDVALEHLTPKAKDRDDDENKIINRILKEEYPRYNMIKKHFKNLELDDYDRNQINLSISEYYESFYLTIKKHDSSKKGRCYYNKLGGF